MMKKIKQSQEASSKTNDLKQQRSDLDNLIKVASQNKLTDRVEQLNIRKK
jgi:hypothetical protein